MKKTNNNRFRNGHNNGHSSQIYSLNYKFDSNSVAGKFSGTALELIKRYNELARDANNNNDIVLAEIFRQYAEHYRKIVTDINDKKITKNNNRTDSSDAGQAVETTSAEAPTENKEPTAETSEEAKTKSINLRKKEFKVIEIKENNQPAIETAEKRTNARGKKNSKKAAENTAEAV